MQTMFQPTLDQQLVYDAFVGDSSRAARHLAQGASPLYMDPIHGSALIQAVRRGSVPMTSMLINHGADANAVFEKTGHCAVDHALELHGHRMLHDLCAYGRSAVSKLSAEDLAEPDYMLWPQTFFDIFAIHCMFDCCHWRACDFGDKGLDQAMESTGLSLDEFAFLTQEVLSAPPAEFAPLGSVGNEVGTHMHHLLATIHRRQENPS
jgi:hypothetical protein